MVELPKAKQRPVCAACGSPDVLCDAYAEWDVETQDWVVQNTFEQTVCNGECGGECSLVWEDLP